MIYLDTAFLTNLGLTDPVPTVRIAVARFWERADVLSEKGISALTAMLDKETDGKVIDAAKEALARRLERASQAGKVDVARARDLQSRYQLRYVILKE